MENTIEISIGLELTPRSWSRKNLENLKRGLGAADVVKLANGFILFSVDDYMENEGSLIFAYKCFKMAPRLIAMVPLKNAKIRGAIQ